MLAALAGHFTVARALVDGGADITVSHKDYGTALQIAEKEGHKQVVTMLQGGAAFDADDAVTVHGLVSAPQHNGKRGVVRSFDAAAGRYIVLLPEEPDVSGLRIKAANLTMQ
jgi:hypothetical protein